MLERSLEVDHSTINRWILKYSPKLVLDHSDFESFVANRTLARKESWAHATCYDRCGQALDTCWRWHLKSTNDAWRVDEPYVKIRGGT